MTPLLWTLSIVGGAGLLVFGPEWLRATMLFTIAMLLLTIVMLGVGFILH